MIRLDKYLADTGAASRREAKAYIRRGEVTVDGVPARAPEQKVAETAVVCLRGQPCVIRRIITICFISPPAFSPRRPTAVSRRCWICSRQSCGASGSCPPGGSIRTRPACCSSRTMATMSTASSRRKSTFRRSISRARTASPQARMWIVLRRASSSATDAVLARPTRAPAGAGGLPRHGL